MEKWLEEFFDQTAEQCGRNLAIWGPQGAERLLGVLMEEVGGVAEAVIEMVTATNPAAARYWCKRVQAEAIDVTSVCAELTRTVAIIVPGNE